MPPAKGPKKPATVTIVRMKRRRHGEKAEYGNGAATVLWAGSGCPGSAKVESIGWPMTSSGLQYDCFWLSSKSRSSAGFSGRWIWTGDPALEANEARSESVMLVEYRVGAMRGQSGPCGALVKRYTVQCALAVRTWLIPGASVTGCTLVETWSRFWVDRMNVRINQGRKKEQRKTLIAAQIAQ